MVLCFSILVSAASLAHSRAHSQYSLVPPMVEFLLAPRIQLQELFECSNSSSWGLIGYHSKLQICNVVWELSITGIANDVATTRERTKS